jgi:F-type H+-transporting ATPase subunit a
LAASVLAFSATNCSNETAAHLGSGCGYPAPGYPSSFNYGPLFHIGALTVNKPSLLAIICAAIVIIFFWSAFSKPKLVPKGAQNLGELGILFVRDQILRPMMGKGGDGYLPFLVSLFFFIWIMNIMEVIPVAQFPGNSEIAFPAALMIMVYGTYNYIGIKRQGLVGYFRNMIPSGVPVGILAILAPVEILQYIIVRPFTLAVRLFANMFAGHILLLVFTLATWYLASVGIGILWSATSFVLTVVLTAFEMLIQALQAYIFTILTAQYIGGALVPDH